MVKAAIVVGMLWGVVSGLNGVKESYQHTMSSHNAAIEQAANQ
jgi:hypothetical protein